MREHECAEWAAEHIAWRGLAIAAGVEAWAGRDVGVSPAIEDDAGDIALGVESARAEHLHHLLEDRGLVVAVRRAEEARAGDLALFRQWETVLVERDIEREDVGLVGVERRAVVADVHVGADVGGEAEPAAP